MHSIIDWSPISDPGVSEGELLFRGKAGCIRCHGDALKPPQFHKRNIAGSELTHSFALYLALAPESKKLDAGELLQRHPALSPLGRYLVTRNIADIGKFKTPSLRHAARTAPYMHDGSIDTLRAAIVHEIYYSTEDHGASFSDAEIDSICDYVRRLSPDSPRSVCGLTNPP